MLEISSLGFGQGVNLKVKEKWGSPGGDCSQLITFSSGSNWLRKGTIISTKSSFGILYPTPQA